MQTDRLKILTQNDSTICIHWFGIPYLRTAKNINLPGIDDDYSLVYREMWRCSIAIQRHIATANSFVILTCFIVLCRSNE